MRILDSNMNKIRALCNKHKVTKLFVFGLILTDAFENSSDIDFLVDFAGVDLYDYADNYFDFKTSLEGLLKRQVDLLEDKAVKNAFLRESIDSSHHSELLSCTLPLSRPGVTMLQTNRVVLCGQTCGCNGSSHTRH